MQSQPEFHPPARRSWRARIVTQLVRWGIRAWPKEDPAKLARRARQFFSLPNPLGFMMARGVTVRQIAEGSVRGEWLEARGTSTGDKVILYLHGGGYVSCSAKSHRSITASLARRIKGRVLSLDYRLAPEFGFPCAVDDAASGYTWLLEQGVIAERISIVGDSAGGGLAIATLLRLRESGLPLPSCVVLLSPWTDLTGEGPYANSGTVSFFQPVDIAAIAEMYLQGASPREPEASPAHADLTGLPPLLIHAAQTELLADDARRLHQRAIACGVSSTLVLFPDLPHVWQMYGSILPEARLALDQAAQFINTHLDGSNASRGPVTAKSHAD